MQQRKDMLDCWRCHLFYFLDFMPVRCYNVNVLFFLLDSEFDLKNSEEGL